MTVITLEILRTLAIVCQVSGDTIKVVDYQTKCLKQGIECVEKNHMKKEFYSPVFEGRLENTLVHCLKTRPNK